MCREKKKCRGEDGGEMTDKRTCVTCKWGLKLLGSPECVAEKCDENYSNWQPDTEISPEQKAVNACELIVALSEGWDINGSTGPKHPLSWESVGRMAMDYAKYALTSEGKREE